MPKSGYYDPRFRSAEFTHRELRSFTKRQQILQEMPWTNFNVEEMNDDNLHEFWYIGVPQQAYGRKAYHTARELAATHFDKEGSFVKRFADSKSPPPLVLIIADRQRRQEYITLKGRAIQSLHRRHHIFLSDASREPEDRKAEDILTESVAEYLSRMDNDLVRVHQAWLEIAH
jgi:hypothetical protein